MPSWVDHLPSERPIEDEVTNILHFLEKHLLHWLEAMSLIERFPDAVGACRKLVMRGEIMLKPNIKYNTFLQDILEFISAPGSIIKDLQLQAYGAVLVVRS
ncbi:hypothetical protein F4810DRAFT_715710 [Camillea tinctor]|nr:hypothetical protein F4810DRAFT_715710 [Camillea tinctor]